MTELRYPTGLSRRFANHTWDSPPLSLDLEGLIIPNRGHCLKRARRSGLLRSPGSVLVHHIAPRLRSSLGPVRQQNGEPGDRRSNTEQR
jgi:hypothetical protein